MDPLKILMDQLPYLGEEKEDGSLQISESISIKKDDWSRPDYNEFISKEVQSELKCVQILLGLINIDTIKLEIEDKQNQRVHSLYTNGPNPSEDFYTSLQKIKFNPFDILLKEIRNTIDDCVTAKTLKGYRDGEYYRSYTTKEPYFKPFIKYRTIDFLNFMLRNSFPIPGKIKTKRNSDNRIISFEKIQDSSSRSFKQENTNSATNWCVEFCKKDIKKKQQPPTKNEIQDFLEKKLKIENIELGENSILPDKIFRNIYKEIPPDLRRKRGVTTKK